MPPKKGPKKKPALNSRSLLEFDEDRHLEEIMDDIKNGVVHVDEEVQGGGPASPSLKRSNGVKESTPPDEVDFIWAEMMEELESNPLQNPSSPGKLPLPYGYFSRDGATDRGARRRTRDLQHP